MQRGLDANNPEMLGGHIPVDIEDSFRLAPAAGSRDGDVERESLCRKLWERRLRILLRSRNQVDQFWEAMEFTSDLPRPNNRLKSEKASDSLSIFDLEPS